MSAEHARDLMAVLGRPVPESCRWRRGSCATYLDVIRLIQGTGSKVFIVGGAVRDLVSGNVGKIADIDIHATSPNRDALVEMIRVNKLAGYAADFRDQEKGGGFFFTFIGCDIGSNVELTAAKGAETVTEVPCNSMKIDMTDLTLIDPSGVGVEDAINKVWRIPPSLKGRERRRAWVDEEGVQRLWRMIKFRDTKGYSVPEADQRLVYESAAAHVRSGKTDARSYFRLLSVVKDPAVWACAIAADAASGVASAADATAVMRGIMESGEVVVPASAPAPKCFTKVCEQREEQIEAREARRQMGRVRARGSAARRIGSPARRIGSKKSPSKLARPSGSARGRARPSGSAEGRARPPASTAA